MEVRHHLTGKTQTIEKKDYDLLVASGHAKNLEVISETDFTPDELKLPAKKGKADTGSATE